MNKLNRRLGDTKPIEGFRVMERLRGVRDASYELSVKDPEAYQRRREEVRGEAYAIMQEQKSSHTLQPLSGSVPKVQDVEAMSEV